VADTIEASLRTRLAATAAVTAIVSTRMYYMQAPQATALPYVILERIDTNRLNTLSGSTTTSEVRIQVACLASTYTGVKALADAVRTSLSGWTSPATDPVVAMVHLIDERDQLQAPQLGEDFGVYEIQQDYNVWYSG